MTDIAIDKTGVMIGISYSRVYRVDATNAQTTLLSSSLDGTFNGLSFVPARDARPDRRRRARRHATTPTAASSAIDPMTGSATQVGDMGGAFKSSGDLVAVAGFGTVQTVPVRPSDLLARLAPQTFAATAVGSGTGFGQIWGVAFWKSKVYGFTNGRHFVADRSDDRDRDDA